MSDAGFRPVEGQSRRINGLDAHVGVYRGRAPEIGDARLRAALFQHGRDVYLLAGVSAVEAFPRADRDFLKTIDSFRPLGAAEAGEIKPNRVDLYVVRPGDSWQLIAARSGQGIVNASALAILNGYDVTMQPEPGARIKIVVAG
jgi:predicted Zn-dependent protease